MATLALPTRSFSIPRFFSTTGSSMAAFFTSRKTDEAETALRDSFSLGKALRTAHEQLRDVFEGCREPRWDGYGAEAVSHRTYQYAYWFLESLPPGIPMPTTGVEADGHLTFEWYRNPNWVLSVSISPEGDLHYAALLGRISRLSGTEPFLGDMPQEILRIIRRLFPHEAALSVWESRPSTC